MTIGRRRVGRKIMGTIKMERRQRDGKEDERENEEAVKTGGEKEGKNGSKEMGARLGVKNNREEKRKQKI